VLGKLSAQRLQAMLVRTQLTQSYWPDWWTVGCAGWKYINRFARTSDIKHELWNCSHATGELLLGSDRRMWSGESEAHICKSTDTHLITMRCGVRRAHWKYGSKMRVASDVMATIQEQLQPQQPCAGTMSRACRTIFTYSSESFRFNHWPEWVTPASTLNTRRFELFSDFSRYLKSLRHYSLSFTIHPTETFSVVCEVIVGVIHRVLWEGSGKEPRTKQDYSDAAYTCCYTRSEYGACSATLICIWFS